VPEFGAAGTSADSKTDFSTASLGLPRCTDYVVDAGTENGLNGFDGIERRNGLNGIKVNGKQLEP